MKRGERKGAGFKPGTQGSKGAALAAVFALLVAVQIVLVAALRIPYGNYQIAKTNDRSQKAYFAALAGAEYGIYVIEKSSRTPTFDPTVQANWPDLDGNGIGGDIPQFSFGQVDSLAITANGANFDVASVGTFSSRNRSVTLTISPTGFIQSLD